jgi:tetratricopeptide (TPR) repeat protein
MILEVSMRRCPWLFGFLALVLVLSPLVADAGPKEIIGQAKALEKAGKLDEALKLYLDGLKATPDEQLYREAGSLLGKLQQYAEAESLLEEGLKKFPDRTSLMNLLALISLRKGNQPKAEAFWRKVLKVDDKNAFALEWLAKVNKPDGQLASPASTQTAPVGDSPVSTVSTPPSGGELPLAEQEKLAHKVYKDMDTLDKWETDKFEALHKQVIEKCPQTEYAQESCWRLSNLYLLVEDEPKYDKIIEVLEPFLSKYPDSPLVPEVKNRLLMAYKNSGNHQKVVEYYQEIFRNTPQPEEREFMVWSLEYADALAASGQKDQAKGVYQQIIEKDNNRDLLEARVARDRVNGL